MINRKGMVSGAPLLALLCMTSAFVGTAHAGAREEGRLLVATEVL